jgi:hypothetical protein
MTIIDRETGEVFPLFPTPALTHDLRAFHAAACTHEDVQLCRLLDEEGHFHYKAQCQTCGELRPTAPLKHDHEPAPVADYHRNLHEDYARARQRELDAIYQKHIRLQKQAGGAKPEGYADYLRSELWQAISAKVMKRANGTCEGCLERPASDVHHLSLANFRNEFMFELVALCPACYERLNPGSTLLCNGCRWQAEKTGLEWCSKFDELTTIAMLPDGECGPDQAGFEPAASQV